MAFIKHTLVKFIKKNPKKFFTVIPLLNGYIVFLSYFIKNKFFPTMDFYLLTMMLLVGVILSFVLLFIYIILIHSLNNNKASERIKYNFNIVFLVVVIVFLTGVFPDRVTSYLVVGNYTGTLILRPEAEPAFSKFYKNTDPSSENTINDVHVVWSSGNRWFFRIPVHGNQSFLIDVNPEFVCDIIKSEKNSVAEDAHQSFIGD